MDLKQFCTDHDIPVEELGPIGEISDGFHTFDSLYHQRLVLFDTLVNTFPASAWKSYRHSDGDPCFGGRYFIVGINTPKGAYTYHYENKDWNMFRCPEVERAPEWDGHTDKDVERLLSLTDEPADWAGREVDLACNKEREMSEKKGDEEYGIACYKGALRAYRSLMRDDYTGSGISITKGILNRLIDGKPLSPIEDTPDIWKDVSESYPKNDTHKHYQCTRMPSFFKDVAPDSTTTCSDISRVYAVNIDNPDNAYTNGFVTRLIDKIFPITMPYFPSSQRFKVVLDEFSTNSANSCYDTVGSLYFVTPDGKAVELNRYFKEVDGKMTSIKKPEFDERKAKKLNKEKHNEI